MSGHLAAARSRLAPLDYRVVRLPDTSSGRRLVVLQESPQTNGARAHGWGLFALDLEPSNQLVVEVPHPLFDIDTPQVGVALFEAARAQALLVAGTHRYADPDGLSDVAHASGSIFATVNRALVRRGSVVVQPHGFDESGHGNDGQIVVSAGASPPPPQVRTVAAELAARGFRTCTYGLEEACGDLGGTQNLQGRWARSVGALFVQVEMALEIREDPQLRQQVAAAITAGLGL